MWTKGDIVTILYGDYLGYVGEISKVLHDGCMVEITGETNSKGKPLILFCHFNQIRLSH